MTDERIITASSGMVLTNGETYGSSVRLGDWDSPENWHEITIEEYEKIIAERESEEGYEADSEEATKADYIEALGRLGVTE